MMIDAMASDGQIDKWLAPTIERGALIPGAGAEPFGVPPTTAKKVAGGYRVNGTETLRHQCQHGRMALGRPGRFGFTSQADHADAAQRYAGLDDR